MPISIPQPLQTIKPVAMQSSSLAQVEYDSRRSILQVAFRDGSTYQYANVPAETYRNLLQADSKGAYFNRHIRNIFCHVALHAAPVASNSRAPGVTQFR